MPRRTKRQRAPLIGLFITLSVLTAFDVEAACSASVSVADQGSTVQITGSGNGSCGGSQLDFYRNGVWIGTEACPETSSCSETFTISKICLTTGEHTVKVVARCSATDQEGECVGQPAGEDTATFTVNSKPTVSVSYAGPDGQGDGVISINYAFQNTSHFGHHRVRYQVFDPSDNIIGGNETTFETPSGTWTIDRSFACRKEGTYRIRAWAFACGGVSPTTYPSDPGFIAESETSVTVPSSKPTLNVIAGTPTNIGDVALSINYGFPNTSSFPSRRIRWQMLDENGAVVRAGNEATMDQQFGTWPQSTWVKCLKSGTYTVRATAFACGTVSPTTYPTDPDYITTAETTIAVNSTPTLGPITRTGPDANGDYTLSFTYDFPNTEVSGSRDLMIYLNERLISTNITAPVQTGTYTFKTKECGEYRIHGIACDVTNDEAFRSNEVTHQMPVTDRCKDDKFCQKPPQEPAFGFIQPPSFAGVSTDAACPCAGRPINLGSGNVQYTERLFDLAQEPASLAFALTYHSAVPMYQSLIAQPLGPRWYHPFAQTLRSYGLNEGLYRVGPDGLETYFTPTSLTTWVASRPADSHATVELVGDQFRLTEGSTTTVFDVEGRWRSTADRWGNQLTATYSGSLLSSVADAMGREIIFTYANDRISTLTVGTSVWRFAYTNGMLSAIFDPLHAGSTAWRTYQYIDNRAGLPRLLTEVRDDAAKIVEGHTYDTFYDRATSSFLEGNRERVTVQYGTPTSSQTRVTHQIDATRTQVADYTLAFQGGRNVVKSTSGACSTCGGGGGPESFTYDTRNRVLTATSAGTTTTYTYGANDEVASVTEATGTAFSRTTTFSYTDAGWNSFLSSISRTSVKPGAVTTTSSTWNTSGAPYTVLTATTSGYSSPTAPSPESRSTTTTFDTRHRIVSIDGPRTDVADVITRSYYPDTDPDLNRRGRLHQIVTPLGHATTYDDYDIFGTARRITDPNGVVTVLVTDAGGRVTSSSIQSVSGDPSETATYTSLSQYDTRDRLVTTTNPRGHVTGFGYEDGSNQLNETIRYDSNGHQRERLLLTLNLLGWKIKEEAQSCPTPASVCATWLTARTESYVYDTPGRLTEIVRADDTRLKNQYDAHGRLIGVTDENNTTPNTTYEYDLLGRLQTVTQRNGTGTITTTYDYDVHDNLASVTDPNGNTTTYQYDDFGTMRSQTSPVTGTTTYSYDTVGNLTESTDANGATTTRTYDAESRPLTAVSAASGKPTETVSWTYDTGAYGKGRVSSMTDPTGGTTYGYERRGLLRSEVKTVEGNTYTTSFTYDANGNRSTLTAPSGRVLAYTHDYADREVALSAGNTLIVGSATYRPFGPPATVTYGNGTTRTTEHDLRYRITTHSLSGPAGAIASHQYTYDAAGNITGIADALESRFNRTFGYDSLHRLTSATTGAALWQAGSYTYDKLGNMLQATVGSDTRTFAYAGTTPKLQSVTANGQTRSVSYDGAGNEVVVGPETFTYTARNHLEAASDLSYGYDGRGVRTITATTPSGATLSAISIDPATVNGETGTTGTVTISGVAPVGGIVVSLTSDDASLAAVPVSVSVAAGQSSATFSITTTRPSETRTIAIRAGYQDVSASADVTVVRDPRASDISFSPSYRIGAGTVTGTVMVDTPALAEGAPVSLTSSDPSIVGVPSSVTIPSGATNTTFTATTSDVSSDTVVTITATAVTTRSATVTVYVPAAGIAGVAVSPSTVVGFTGSTGTVQLASPAGSSGAVVTLTSSNTSVATVPTSVTVAAGTTSASFAVSTTPVAADTPLTINATYGTTESATLTVASCTNWVAAATTLGSETVWFDDAVPAGATAQQTWLWDTIQKTSGTQSHTIAPGPGNREWSFRFANPRLQPFTANDLIVTYVLLDPCNPPREIMLEFERQGFSGACCRAYWGQNLIAKGTDGTNSRRRIGDLPPLGQWTRLEIPGASLGMTGLSFAGMTFNVYDGRAWFDRTGLQACVVNASAPTIPATDVLFFDDDLPPGATATNWTWATDQKASGTRSRITNTPSPAPRPD